MLSTTLRRILVASSLALATSGFMASSAFSQYVPPAAKTNSIDLEGVVNSTLSLDVTADKDLGSITTGSAQSVEVGTATVSTNNTGGLTLYLTVGANDFLMTNTTAGTDTFGFTVSSKVANVLEEENRSGTGIVDGLLYASLAPVTTPVEVDLFINYTAPATQEPGLYTGSIGLTLVDN